MMKRLCQRVFVLGVLGSVTACSSLFGPEGYFRDRGDNYLKADVIPPITLPEGVEAESIADLYVIPANSNSEFDERTEFVVPRPQPLSANAFTDLVKIQKLADERWILVNVTPSEVWPKVRHFLSSNRLHVVYTDATNGVIETGWLQFKDETDLKDKYRLQIEQGVQPNTAEIHVLHMQIPTGIPGRGQVNWPSRSMNPEREAWMLEDLAATLASDVTTGQSASLLAQTIGGSDKVTLESANDEPLLSLDLGYKRAWATVGHALNKDGYHLWEQDDVVGVYYVDFIDSEEQEDNKPGFFARLLGADDVSGAPTTPYALADVLAHLQLDDTAANREIFSSINSSAQDPLSDVPGYLVVVRGLEGKIEVRIRDGYARSLETKKAKQLLNVIRRNLI